MRLARLLAVTSTLLIACGFIAASGAAPSGSTRQALLIGNAAYPDGDAELTTPANDADKLSEALQRLGFQTEVQKNLGRKEMDGAIERFLQRLDAGSTALLFFGGYGVQAGGKNYLIPLDARIWTEEDVAREGVFVDGLLAKIAARKVETRILLVDASRRNPFERRFRSVSPGLAAPPSGAGTLAFYSAVGGVANDPPAAKNSLFVTEIIRQIGDPERDVGKALAGARDEMRRQAKSEPAPHLENGLTAPVWLDGAARAPGVARAPEAPVKPPEAPKAPEKPVAEKPAPAKPVAIAPPPAPTSLKPPAPPAHAPTAERRPVEIKEYSSSELTLKAELDARISRNPGDESSISRRGQLLALHRQYAAALADFERSTKLNPDNVESWNNRCWIRAIANELARALDDCNEALRRRPDFADALDSRGLVRLKQGDLAGAIEDYNEALKRNARHASSLYGRGLSRLRLGQADKADEDFAKARTINPSIENDFKDYGVD